MFSWGTSTRISLSDIISGLNSKFFPNISEASRHAFFCRKRQNRSKEQKRELKHWDFEK